MIRRPPRSTPLYSSAASDVYKRQPERSSVTTPVRVRDGDCPLPVLRAHPVTKSISASSEGSPSPPWSRRWSSAVVTLPGSDPFVERRHFARRQSAGRDGGTRPHPCYIPENEFRKLRTMIRMYRRVAGVGLALTMLVAGCGHSSSTSQGPATSSTPVPSVATSSTRAASATSQACLLYTSDAADE